MSLFNTPAVALNTPGSIVDLDPLIEKAIGEAGPSALYVEVPAHADRSLVVLSSLARQCGADATRSLRAALDQSGSLRSWFQAVEPFVAGRPLVVHMLSSQASAIGDVVGDRAGLRWLAEHRTPGKVVFSSMTGVSPSTTPVAAEGWDSARLWEDVARDVDRYVLAAAHITYAGRYPGRRALSSTERLAEALWSELPDVIQDLVGLLLTHERAIAEVDLIALDLATSDVVERAVASHLVERRAGQLVVARGLRSTARARPHAVVSAQHLRLARSFEQALQTSNIDFVTATLEAHRHYASILRSEDAFRLARFGFGVLLEMAVEQSKAKSFEEAVATYERVAPLIEAARLSPPERQRLESYVTHYLHYNRYRARKEPLAGTLTGYQRSVALWPDNALFAARHVRALFYAHREDEALAALRQAWTRAPSPAESAKYLLDRSVIRLLDRDIIVPAIATADAAPAQWLAEPTHSRLRAARTWETRRLWAPTLPAVDLPTPMQFSLSAKDETWRAEGPGVMCTATEPLAALTGMLRRVVFATLAERWVRATAHSSSRRRCFEHEDYKTILKMGSSAVPDILRWIRSGKGGHWDQALLALAPIPAPAVPDQATLSQVMRSWVDWGESTGLIERR